MARRSTVQREKDLEELSLRYLRGEFQSSIAEDMGVSQPTISNDLKTLQARWLKSSLLNVSTWKAEQLAKVDQLEREYWLAWERSQEDAETEVIEKIGKADKDGKPTADRIKQNKRKEGQSGNPSFLSGVQWCINKRCEILGLDAPKSHEVKTEGSILIATIANQELMDELKADG